VTVKYSITAIQNSLIITDNHFKITSWMEWRNGTEDWRVFMTENHFKKVRRPKQLLQKQLVLITKP